MESDMNRTNIPAKAITAAAIVLTFFASLAGAQTCGWRIDNITPRLAFGTTRDSASATGTNQALLVAQIP